MLLWRPNVGGDNVGGKIGRFVGLYGGVGTRGDGARGVDFFVCLIVYLPFFFQVSEFILDFPFQAVCCVRGVRL